MRNQEVAHMSDRIEKTVELNAPVERVWRALTDHKEFGEWFRVKLDGPFAPGEISTGQMTYPGYEHIKWNAAIEQMEAPRLFSFRWPHEGIEPDATTLVEFRLEPTSKGTRLTIIESGFDALPANRRAEAFRMNEGGWEEQTRNVKAHVER
jgi:uncharacterized protein YndB with AHSA1/START domain